MAALVIVGWLIAASLLVYQAIYILRTGRITPSFTRPEYSRTASRLIVRLAYAFLYLFPAVAMVVILARELTRAGVGRVWAWVSVNLGMLCGPLLIIVIGFLLLVQPEKMLRWTIRDHPELADNRFGVITTRFIGLGLLSMGFAMLATL